MLLQLCNQFGMRVWMHFTAVEYFMYVIWHLIRCKKAFTFCFIANANANNNINNCVIFNVILWILTYSFAIEKKRWWWKHLDRAEKHLLSSTLMVHLAWFLRCVHLLSTSFLFFLFLTSANVAILCFIIIHSAIIATMADQRIRMMFNICEIPYYFPSLESVCVCVRDRWHTDSTVENWKESEEIRC